MGEEWAKNPCVTCGKVGYEHTEHDRILCLFYAICCKPSGGGN